MGQIYNYTPVTVNQYLATKTTTLQKIQALDALIDSMLMAATNAAGTADLVSYQMDDGQMRVQAEYRNPDALNSAINGLEKIRQRYINRYNGGVTILRSKLNF